MFSIENIDIEFEDDALEEVAKKAIRLKTGARGLRTILEEVMLPIMYAVPSDKTISKITITKGVILGKDEPIYEHRELSDLNFDVENENIVSSNATTVVA